MANPIIQSLISSASASTTQDALAALKAWLGQLADDRTPTARSEFARAVTATVVRAYWQLCCAAAGSRQSLRKPPAELTELATGNHLQFAELCSTLSHKRAFFEIGELYTSLLPAEQRSRNGVYYTPPELVAQLIDLTTAAGLNWTTARILDPACGGAAFLAHLAERMLAESVQLTAEERLCDLELRLVGMEIDPFAAWLSEVLVDVVTMPLAIKAGRKIASLVQHVDTLKKTSRETETFDLVIGNPPYGKITLAPPTRELFSRSLFGHANLYGLFTDAAIDFCRGGGLIAYVTPTSFLGGEYFKNLRKLLSAEAPLQHASFVQSRDGVFSGVLQETMLAVFRRDPGHEQSHADVTVDIIHSATTDKLEVKSLGTQRIGTNSNEPWILPRSPAQARLVKILNRLPARLADYGYHVSTGQLVWNRHKAQLRAAPGRDCFPIIWAEAIQANGSFVFQAENRNHSPYLHVEEGQNFLINYEPCILVQRTTSKEQARRLIAAMVPNEFIMDHAGYVVENHVNMIVPSVSAPAVSLQFISRLLNSKIVDDAFRCISGSVAVSAYELESLPLPDPREAIKATRGRLALSTAAAFEYKLESIYYGP